MPVHSKGEIRMHKICKNRFNAALGIAIIATGVPQPAVAGNAIPLVQAVEYYHQEFEHYFVTAHRAEIDALDAGAITGWWRTGQRYQVESEASANRAPVCRFFTGAFAGKASHFFTAWEVECEYVKKNLPEWTYEGVAFHVQLPQANGACPSGTAPVYRLFNAGRGGAPNHAYTADATKRELLISAGFVTEGTAWCVPDAPADPAEQTHLLAGTRWELSPNPAVYGDGRGTTTFAAQLSTSTERQQRYDYFGLTNPPAAISHGSNGVWWGYAHFEPLTGHFLLFGSSGFEGDPPYIGGAWELDDVGGSTTPTLAFAVKRNVDSRYPNSVHPFQPIFWSGGTPGLSNRVLP